MTQNVESITDTLKKGYRNLRNNTSILSPILIEFIVLFVVIIVLGIIAGVVAAMSMAIGSSAFMIVYIVLVCLITLIALIIASYFNASLVGLAKDAIANGTVNWNDMWAYGKKYFVRFFLFSLIIGIISALFQAPYTYEYMNSMTALIDSLGNLNTTSMPYYQPSLMLGVYSIIGSLLTLVLSFVTFFVTAAIIVDDLSLVDGFKKSFAVLKENFVKVLCFFLVLTIVIPIVIVFVLVVIPFVIIILLTMVSPIIGVILMLIWILALIVFLVFYTALSVVWTTRYYMSLTGKPIFDETVKADANDVQIKNDDEEENELNN